MKKVFDYGVDGLEDGDILTNENGMTCIYGTERIIPRLTDVDKLGELTGDHIAEYIQQHNLKVTDHVNNY